MQSSKLDSAVWCTWKKAIRPKPGDSSRRLCAWSQTHRFRLAGFDAAIGGIENLLIFPALLPGHGKHSLPLDSRCECLDLPGVRQVVESISVSATSPWRSHSS